MFFVSVQKFPWGKTSFTLLLSVVCLKIGINSILFELSCYLGLLATVAIKGILILENHPCPSHCGCPYVTCIAV